MHNLSWEIFEIIHGKRMERVMYGGVACVRNGRNGDMISIMPANPQIDIGKGIGQTVWVFEQEVDYYN